MLKNTIKTLIFAAALIFQPYAYAEDIDLFVGATPGEAPKPNVLILLDNTGNWSQPFQNEIAALVTTFNALPENKFRVGLMMFSETGGGNSTVDGGYIRAAIRDMTLDNKDKYSALISSLDSINDRSNSGKLGKTMAEAYFYFAGKAPYGGHNKLKTDFTGNVQSGAGLAASRAIWALTGNALQSFSGSPSNKYISPVSSGDACAKNFIIYISNGAAQDSNADSVEAANLLSAAGGSTTTIPISPSDSMGNMGDEWARFMKSSNEEITTYTIDVNKVTTGQGPGWTALLKSMANVSDGKYFDVVSQGDQIVKALNAIFSEIQSVNSVFASVSLPISVNTQGTYLNQVYVGMFRPEELSGPRWPGNLKQYKLGFEAGALKLLDADDKTAINANTGFIAECARSFWTPMVIDSYWPTDLGECLLPNAKRSNSPDGDVVEKGAQAYMLRSIAPSSRNLQTCSSAACTGLSDFKADFSDARISADATERNKLINWLRGQNLAGEMNKTLTEMRPSVHGDVVHSRPVAINYGTDEIPQVVVFYGGNDGILRAINGNREDDSNIAGKAPGMELWGFVVPEFFSRIKRLYDDSPAIKFPGQLALELDPPPPPPIPKDYGVDGSITAYAESGSAWIFATLRRGGRAFYAFDFSNLDEGQAPSIKWRIGCPNADNDIDCTSGYADMGQSWSSLRPISASGYNDGITPLLMVGGGYDTCHDNPDDQNTAICGSKGRKIYVIDADNGSLVKAFNTDSSVVGDIAIVPDAESGLIKYAYAADLGGNVYRISGATANSEIGATPPANWTITKIAAFGGAGVDNRKFMFAPDVLDEGGGNYVLLLGSGDREKPLTSYTTATMVNNRFYMIKDKPTDSSWLASENFNCGADMICHASLVAITSNDTPTDTELKQKKGWYLALKSSEQVVTTAITVFGTVTFSTHEPTPPEAGSCGSNLGTARVYNISYRNATSRNGTLTREQIIVGGGLPPSPVAGMVTLDDGRTIPFIIGAKPTSALEGAEPPPPSDVFRPKGRVYWNIKK